MSMTVTAGDDSDEIDDDLEERDDDLDEDDEDERPARKSKAKAEPEDDDQDDLDDKSDEELRAEVKRLRSAVAKSNATGRRQREKVKELRAAQAALDSREDDDEDDEDDKPAAKKSTVGLDAKAAQRLITKAVSRREQELQKEHTRDLIDTRAESALVKAGVSEKNIRLLKRELDYDELELDSKTRSVDGIEEEIDRLKTEFPDLFRSAKAARRRINGGDDREGPSKRRKLSATEQQVLKLTGRAS